jgi:hypothetical protein
VNMMKTVRTAKNVFWFLRKKSKGLYAIVWTRVAADCLERIRRRRS